MLLIQTKTLYKICIIFYSSPMVVNDSGNDASNDQQQVKISNL